MLLLLGAPAQDGRAHQRGLHRDDRAHRRAATAHLLDDEAIGDVVQTGAPVLPGDDGAEVALIGDLGHQLGVEVLVTVVVARAWDDLPVGEVPGGLPDETLLVGQFEVHGPQVIATNLPSCLKFATPAALSITSPTRWWATGRSISSTC